VVLSVIKLAVHPLIVWVLAAPVFGLEGLWVSVPVVMASMPSAVNVYLFGARYDTAPGVAARTVLVTTVGSVVTIAVVLLLVGGS
jgi:malonate transporter